jgi:hypothetical protein
MAVPVRRRREQETKGDSGDLRAMHLHKPCRHAGCLEHGATALGDEDLCCDHFVLRCYEFLQQIDAERGKHGIDFLFTTDLKDSVNNCLHGALEISLRSESLSNLQKARLLDIMLWAGEFIHRADAARFGTRGLCVSGVNEASSGQRAAYMKPEVKTRTSLLRN